MNTKIFYHCWTLSGEVQPVKNTRTPTILSIATLRSFNQDIPVCVLDCSDFETDWGNLPSKLNFEVRRIKCETEQYQHLIPGWKHLSRIFDLFSQPENEIVYIDSDCFFLRDPFPLEKGLDKFCWDGWNSGVFYLDKSSEINKVFFDIFNSYTKTAIYCEDFKNMLKQYATYDGWYGVWDELILCFMRNKHPELFNFIDEKEHGTYRKCHYETKIFHSNGLEVKNEITSEKFARGILCLIAKELYQSISSVLSHDDLVEIFGQKTLNFYLKNQKSIEELILFFSSVKPSVSEIIKPKFFF